MSAAAAGLPNDRIADLIEGASPSVVRVRGRGSIDSTGVVWSAEGLIVTAHHTVHRDEHLKVVLEDGTELDATLVGRDPGTDVAVLKVEGQKLTPPKWSDVEGTTRVGHVVLALGRPGKTVRATMGIVGVLGGEYRTNAGGKVERFVQPDNSLPRGFSGGLLLDLEGRALGINTMALTRGGLTVPTETLRRVVAEIGTHGRVRKGFLGVGVYPVSLPAAQRTAAGQESGALVVAIAPDSPAEKAGVTVGDIILAIDGEAVATPADLSALLSDRVEREVTMKILRAGTVSEVKATTATREARRRRC
jgi:S1-C subfamily serine protease